MASLKKWHHTFDILVEALRRMRNYLSWMECHTFANNLVCSTLSRAPSDWIKSIKWVLAFWVVFTTYFSSSVVILILLGCSCSMFVLPFIVWLRETHESPTESRCSQKLADLHYDHGSELGFSHGATAKTNGQSPATCQYDQSVTLYFFSFHSQCLLMGILRVRGRLRELDVLPYSSVTEGGKKYPCFFP